MHHEEIPGRSGATSGKRLRFALALSHPVLLTPLYPMTTMIRFCAEGF
jgi:hypothetical protein